MTSYQTDEEQVEALKNWWKENGRSTIFVISLGLIAVFGWQTWQKRQQHSVDAASLAYQQLLVAAREAEANATDSEAVQTVIYLADTIKDEYPKTAYAQFASLFQAKFNYAKDDLDAAEAALRWVLERGEMDSVKALAQLRLAKLLYAQDRNDEALALLTKPANRYYPAQFAELSGDIFLEQGFENKAREAYQRALKVSKNAPLLEMKLNQLAAETDLSSDQEA